MGYILNSKVILSEEANELFPEAMDNERHTLTVNINQENTSFVELLFTSKLAMYQFGLSLMHDAIYRYGGSDDPRFGVRELSPFEYEEYKPVIDGVRLDSNSTRLIISLIEQ